jgi:hypothetical protein
MNSSELRQVQTFENSLVEGASVRINWTNSNRYFSGLGTVHKVNAQSFVVSLTEHVQPEYYGGYPVGHKIKAPRLVLGGSGFKLWSANNRVEPANGY